MDKGSKNIFRYEERIKNLDDSSLVISIRSSYLLINKKVMYFITLPENNHTTLTEEIFLYGYFLW